MITGWNGNKTLNFPDYFYCRVSHVIHVRVLFLGQVNKLHFYRLFVIWPYTIQKYVTSCIKLVFNNFVFVFQRVRFNCRMIFMKAIVPNTWVIISKISIHFNDDNFYGHTLVCSQTILMMIANRENLIVT